VTAARTLLDHAPDRISPIMADALMTYIDVIDVELDTDEAAAIFAKSRDLVAGLTPDQARRLRSIVHTLRNVNLRQ
jgi:hypothetical protein